MLRVLSQFDWAWATHRHSPLPLPPHHPPQVRDLIAHMLKTDPTRRLSASEALLNSWVLGTSHTPASQQPLSDAHDNLAKKLHDREKREREKAARAAKKANE